MVVLSTAAQITKYIKSLSDFIDLVKITEVHEGGFSFRVKVPRWYKLVFGKNLRKTIQRELSERMIVGVSFQFDIYSEQLF